MSLPADPRRLPPAMGIAGAVLVGVLTACQARVNGTLGATLGDGFLAAVISFGSGLVVLIALTLVSRGGRSGWGRLVRGVRAGSTSGARVPVWMLLGGLAGAFTVVTQTLAVPLLGVALFTVGVVGGQTAAGLVIDRAGFGPAGVQPLTRGRLLGGVLALLAVIACLSGDTLASAPWLLAIMPIVAGAGIGWQQATNGRLRQRVGSPLTATLVNFAGGTAVLVLAALVHVAIAGAPSSGRLPVAAEAWMYLGGTIGVSYIFLSAALVHHTGVLLLGLGSVAGLLATSIVLDAVWPPAHGPALPAALLGAALAITGAVVAAVPWRRRST